jgi:RNA polymerase sigma-70 factor (ECF subfamily)
MTACTGIAKPLHACRIESYGLALRLDKQDVGDPDLQIQSVGYKCMIDRDRPEAPDPDSDPPAYEDGEGYPGLSGSSEDGQSSLDEASFPQHADDTGVPKGMATIALDRTLLKGVRAEAVRSTRIADWNALSDAEIMLRVREGDDAGYNYLIEKYRKPIIHFMFRMVHNQAVAEELTQEVFLRVYRSRETYRAEARFSTWLYRIATNLGVNHARDTKHERAAQNVYLDQPDPETGTTPDVADSTPSVEQDLVRNERMQAIRRHVMALPERQRTAVLMHKYQGMDYKQIGEVLKLSESATKSLLFRAYQTLRERLKEFV